MLGVDSQTQNVADWAELHLRLKKLTGDYYQLMLQKEYECAAEVLLNINTTSAALLFLHTSGRVHSGAAANRNS